MIGETHVFLDVCRGHKPASVQMFSRENIS